MDEYEYQKTVEKLLQKILNFLSLQPRSCWEIERAIKKYSVRLKLQSEDREKINKYILTKLKEENLANDDRFVKDIVLSFSMSSKPRSRSVIQKYLVKKHIPNELISRHISTINSEFELNSAVEIAKKKLRIVNRSVWEKPGKTGSTLLLRHKLANYLYQKGFSGEISRRAVDIILSVK